MKRLMASVLRGAMVLAVLAVVPAGLWLLFPWQKVPAPSLDTPGAAATATLLPLLVDAVGVLAAMWWLLLLYVTTARLAERLLRIKVPVPRLAMPLHAAVGSVLGASAVASVVAPAAATAHVAITQTAGAGIPGNPAGAVSTPDTMQQVRFVAGGTTYVHVVRKGEYLSKIAEMWLGDPGRWPEICDLNKHRHFPRQGGTLRDCNLIYPGWDLILPADAAAALGAATQPELPPTTPLPAGQSATATMPPAATPEVSSPAAVHSTTGTANPALASATSMLTPLQTAQRDEAGDIDTSSTTDGITIPGGWIVPALAAVLLALAARVWAQRRRAYSPAFGDAEPYLASPLPAATRIKHALRQRWRRLSPAAGTPDHDTDTDAAPRAAPEEHTVPSLDGLTAAPGTALAGPGADGAARALLITALGTAALEPQRSTGNVIIPAETLARLCDDASTPSAVSGLTVTANAGQALTCLEEHLISRSRTASETSSQPAFTPLLLLADVPEPRWHRRLLTAVALGSNLGIDVIVIGTWPHGQQHTVDADGTVSETGRRLSHVDTATLADTLQMLAEIGGAPEPALPPPPAPVLAGQDIWPHVRVRARVLGQPAILDVHGKPVLKLRSKSLELLVYLAVNRSGATLATIMEALWPDITMRRASERLSTCTANLRRAIRTAHAQALGGDSDPDVEPVINSGGHYRLDPAILDIDWWAVQEAASEAKVAPDPLPHLQTAISHLCGPLADDLDYEWIAADREHVRRQQISIYAKAAELATSSDPGQAHAWYEAACDIDPLNEELAVRSIHAAAQIAGHAVASRRLAALRSGLITAGLTADSDTITQASNAIDSMPKVPGHERLKA